MTQIRIEQILNFNGDVLNSTLTGYTSGSGTVTSSDSILVAIQKIDGNVGALTTGVSSVFGRSGVVVAASNDYTFAQIGSKPTTISGYGITDTISQTLTGYTSGAGTISSTDTLLGAIQKLNGNDTLKAPLNSPAFTGTPIAPTPGSNINTTQIPTTAWVNSYYAPLVNTTLNSLSLGTFIFPYISYDAYGDSLTAAVGASSAAAGYVARIGNHINLTPTNHGVSGDMTADQQVPIYGTTITNNGNQLLTLGIGSNDVGSYLADANKQSNFSAMNMAAAVYLAIPNINKIKGQAGSGITYTGSWTNSTYYGGAISKQSATNGDTVSFSVSGTTIYIAYTLLDGNGGTANVVVDGGAPIAISCFGAGGTAIATTNGLTNGSALLRIAGLSAGAHSVVITVTSATSAGNKVIFDWASGNSNLYPVSGKPTVLQADVPQRFTQPDVPTYSTIIKNNVISLQADGLNIYQVLIQNDFDKYSQTSTVGSHPNDAGYYVLYNKWRTVLDTITTQSNVYNQIAQNAQVNGLLNVVDNITAGGIITPNISTNNILYGLSLQNGITMSVGGVGVSLANQFVTNTVGNYSAVSITPTINQASGSSNNTALLVNVTETLVSSGTQLLVDLQKNGSSQFNVDHNGLVNIPGSIVNGLRTTGGITSSSFGTTGVNFSIAGATYTDSTSSGTVAGVVAINSVSSPTINATIGSVTYSQAATWYIGGAPIAGTGVTALTGYALYVNSGTSYFQGGIKTNTITSQSNFATGGASNTSTGTTQATVLFGGASTIHFRTLMAGTGAATLTTGISYTNLIVGSAPISTFSSGTHAMLANAVINPIGTITAGGATVTNTATLLINGQSASGGTNNYGLLLQSANIGLAGSSSGVITLQTQAAAGTYNWNFPITSGSAGQVLLSGGGGTTAMTWGFTYRGSGQTTLIAGTKAISISGVTTSSQAFITGVTQGGTITTSQDIYAVCTSGTVTFTALTASNTTDTSDTSTFNYFVIN